MASETPTSPTDKAQPLTAEKRPTTTVFLEAPQKKFAESNEQSAADYLLDQRRIDQYNTNP
jgi:hypothetical protein